MAETYQLDKDAARLLESGLWELACDNDGVFMAPDIWKKKLGNEHGGLSCALFEVVPQWYGDSSSYEADKPNFRFFGIDDIPAFSITWYKHVAGSPQSDRLLERNELGRALAACSKFLRENADISPTVFDDKELLNVLDKFELEDISDDYANVVVEPWGDGMCSGFGYVTFEEAVIHVNLSDDSVCTAYRWFAHVSDTGAPGEKVGRVNGGYETMLEAACAVAADILEHR